MKKLNEREVAKCYVGKTVDSEKLLPMFHNNGENRAYDIYTYKPIEGYFTNHIAYCSCFDKETRDQFGITPLLHERWGYAGIDFNVYIYVANGEIKACKIFKYKECSGGYHGRPSGYELTPSQQEIRIFRRIMDYITQSKGDDR